MLLGLEKLAKYTCQSMCIFNSQSWCSEPCLSTDRRTMYRTSRVQAYPLNHLTLRTSMSILDIPVVWYSYQGQHDDTTVSYDDEHHHAPCHWYPVVVHDVKNGHILQTAWCTMINPTDYVASLTYSGAQFWKQRSRTLTRPSSHTLSRPGPLCNASKADLISLKCGKQRPNIPCPALIHVCRIQYGLLIVRFSLWFLYKN